MSITGIVLCGGRSTRMGQDKAALLFAGETLRARAVRVLQALTGDVIVVGRADQDVSGLAVRVIHDPVEGLGPLAGLAAGLAASPGDVNLVLACDMPLASPLVLQRLMELRGDHDICVAVIDGRPSPLCAVYRAGVARVAQDLLAAGERRVMALLDRVETKRVDAAVFRDIDPDLVSFLSCNTPDDLERAALKRRPPGT